MGMPGETRVGAASRTKGRRAGCDSLRSTCLIWRKRSRISSCWFRQSRLTGSFLMSATESNLEITWLFAQVKPRISRSTSYLAATFSWADSSPSINARSDSSVARTSALGGNALFTFSAGVRKISSIKEQPEMQRASSDTANIRTWNSMSCCAWFSETEAS
ncbi:hypothetical protein FQZ97_780780 [compost metagenome]